MQPIETLALSKAANGTAKQARTEVAPGSHPVDFTVRIQGKVNVGEDYKQAPTASIPFKKALAALVHVSGCTGQAGIAKIEKAMRIALELDADAGDVLKDIIPQIDAIEKRIIAPMLAKLPKGDCKGKVTTKLTITPLTVVPTDTASPFAAMAMP